MLYEVSINLAYLTSLVRCACMCVWGDVDDVEVDAANEKKMRKYENGRKRFVWRKELKSNHFESFCKSNFLRQLM